MHMGGMNLVMDDAGSARTGLSARAIGAANTPVDGGWVDRLNFMGALLIIQASGTAAGGLTVQLQHSVDNAGTGAANYGNPATVSFGAGATTTVQEMNVVLAGAKRFIRVRVTPTGTAAGTMSVALMLGHGNSAPMA